MADGLRLSVSTPRVIPLRLIGPKMMIYRWFVFYRYYPPSLTIRTELDERKERKALRLDL